MQDGPEPGESERTAGPPAPERPMPRGCVLALAVGGIIATLVGVLIAIGVSAVGSGFCDDNGTTASSCKSDALTTGVSLSVLGALVIAGIVYATWRWYRNHPPEDGPQPVVPVGRDPHGT